MNRLNKQIFDIIAGRCSGLIEDRRRTFNDYTARTRQARANSERFKNENEVFEAEHGKILAETRAELATQSKDFARKISDSAAQLKGELAKHIAEPVAPTVLDRLRVYREFGVKPSRTEVEQLIEANHGSALGLCVISNVLEAVKSPYRLNFKTPSDYEKDIEAVEQLASTADGFAPMDTHSAACAAWAGQQVPGGIIGQTWDTTGLMLQRHLFETALKQVTSAADSWVSDVAYQLVEEALPLDEDETPPPSSTGLEEKAADPVEEVRTRAQARAAMDAQTEAALRTHYMK